MAGPSLESSVPSPRFGGSQCWVREAQHTCGVAHTPPQMKALLNPCKLLSCSWNIGRLQFFSDSGSCHPVGIVSRSRKDGYERELENGLVGRIILGKSVQSGALRPRMADSSTPEVVKVTSAGGVLDDSPMPAKDSSRALDSSAAGTTVPSPPTTDTSPLFSSVQSVVSESAESNGLGNETSTSAMEVESRVLVGLNPDRLWGEESSSPAQNPRIGPAHSGAAFKVADASGQFDKSARDTGEAASSASISEQTATYSEQSNQEQGAPRKSRAPKKYVWPELRTEASEFEFRTIDPSEIPERRSSSQGATSSGRIAKNAAPTPSTRKPMPKKTSVKRPLSAAARECLALMSAYQDPGNMPFEDVKETLTRWVAEHSPRRSDGMDVLRTLLEYRETQVFSRVAEHFLREPWFKATVKDHNKLLDLFVKNGLFIKAENRYRQMLAKGFPPDVTTYNLMIHHYGLWNKVDRAEEMFLEMRSKGLRANEDTFVALMGALTRAGRLTEAERLLKTMRKSKCPRGSAAYVTLMEAYGRKEEPEEAERIFLLMQVDGIPLDRPAFLGLMHVYSEVRKPHHVENVFREMLSKRILPDETAYLVLIDSYRLAGLGRNCERLMEEMKLLGLSLYKAAAMIMEAYGKEQLFSEAERILIDMEGKTGQKPGVIHYNALLASYGRHGLHKDAMKVFDWMAEAGIPLNERSHVLILDLFDRTGRKANLRHAFRVMQEDGFGLEYEVADEAVQEYRRSLGEFELEEEEIREERNRAKFERAKKFMDKWNSWSRELDELDREIAEVELKAERKMNKWETSDWTRG